MCNCLSLPRFIGQYFQSLCCLWVFCERGWPHSFPATTRPTHGSSGTSAPTPPYRSLRMDIAFVEVRSWLASYTFQQIVFIQALFCPFYTDSNQCSSNSLFLNSPGHFFKIRNDVRGSCLYHPLRAFCIFKCVIITSRWWVINHGATWVCTHTNNVTIILKNVEWCK